MEWDSDNAVLLFTFKFMLHFAFEFRNSYYIGNCIDVVTAPNTCIWSGFDPQLGEVYTPPDKFPREHPGLNKYSSMW